MRATGPGQSALLLVDVVEAFGPTGMEYAVLGAMAGSVHGAVRASLDADAVAFISIGEARTLASALADRGLRTRLTLGDADDPIAALLAIDDVHGNRVDVLIGLRGLGRSALARAIDVPFAGGVLRVLGREDFIASKLYAGGPRDLADARAALADAPVDLDLLRKLAAQFGAATVERLDALLQS